MDKIFILILFLLTFVTIYQYSGNYSAPPQNIGYAVKLAIKSWQV